MEPRKRPRRNRCARLGDPSLRGCGGLDLGGLDLGLVGLLRARGPGLGLGRLGALAGVGHCLRMLGKHFVMVNHPDDIEAVFVKHAAVMGRDAYIDTLKRTLGDGRIEDTLYQIGEWVPAGAPVLKLLPASGPFVRFFVPQS